MDLSEIRPCDMTPYLATRSQKPSWLKINVKQIAKWAPPNESKEAIRLDLNENQFIQDDSISELIKGINWSNLHQYPTYNTLYESLAADSGLDSKYLLSTNGADQAIEIVIRSLNPALKVVLAVPTFSYYQHVLSLEGLQVDKVFYSADLSLDVEKIIDSITENTGSILLTSPSNPLTTSLTENEVVYILQMAEAHDVLVVIDEVYARFTQTDFGHLVSRFKNLVLIRSFSKFHGLASLRMGYIVADPEVISQMSKVRGPWDVSELSAQLVSAAVFSTSWLDYLPSLVANRQVLIDGLESIGATVAPSNVSFILFFHPQALSIRAQLRQKNIVLASLKDYPDSGGLLHNALRMAVPNKTQLDYILDTLKGLSI
jgi:histidinol-phosphate aminotransferase